MRDGNGHFLKQWHVINRKKKRLNHRDTDGHPGNGKLRSLQKPVSGR